MITVSGYLERTEIRHELYTYYDADGAFDIEYKNATGVSYTLVARDYTLTNGSAAFGEHFAVDPLLKGWKDNDHTYTLTFSDGSVAAP